MRNVNGKMSLVQIRLKIKQIQLKQKVFIAIAYKRNVVIQQVVHTTTTSVFILVDALVMFILLIINVIKLVHNVQVMEFNV